MSLFRRKGAHAHPATQATAPAVGAPTSTTASQSFPATMMDFPLTLQHFYDRATLLFPTRELVTVTADGMERSTYGQAGQRIKQLAAALDKLGIGKGQ